MKRNGGQRVKCVIGNQFVMRDIWEDLYKNVNNDMVLKFYQEGHIKLEKLKQVYRPETIQYLIETTLMVVAEHKCYTAFNCSCFEGFILFSDPDIPDDQQEPFYVDPLWDKYLSKLLIRKPVDKSLDMGGGSGIISLVLSRFSREVYCVDINPRALEIAKLNAQINGVENIIFVHSDLFKNVPELKFDYIVFNSPTDQEGKNYVKLLETGEEILTSFFSKVLSYLDQDGICQVSMGIFDDEIDAFQKIENWAECAQKSKLYLVMRTAQIESKTWRRMHLTILNAEGTQDIFSFSYDKLSDNFEGQVSSEFIAHLLKNNKK